ncbi:hypothetical protein SUGI_0854720 [Cryptomeria japonica]|nr:hypothetical protein SUGI_0854720 [Cryptomeria japonica]
MTTSWRSKVVKVSQSPCFQRCWEFFSGTQSEAEVASIDDVGFGKALKGSVDSLALAKTKGSRSDNVMKCHDKWEDEQILDGINEAFVDKNQTDPKSVDESDKEEDIFYEVDDKDYDCTACTLVTRNVRGDFRFALRRPKQVFRCRRPFRSLIFVFPAGVYINLEFLTVWTGRRPWAGLALPFPLRFSFHLFEKLFVHGEDCVDWSKAMGRPYPVKSISSDSIDMDDVFRLEKLLGNAGLMAAGRRETVLMVLKPNARNESTTVLLLYARHQ